MIARDLSNPKILAEIRKNPVAIIPVGSTEQHGGHLPISTDSDIVSFIAGKLSERTGFLLMPTVECGVSTEHHPFFNLSTSPSTLRRYVADICKSLWRYKVRTVIVLNGHHGNLGALRGISQMAVVGSGRQVRVYSYWHFMNRRFDHAGFVETSIMLAISRHVKMSKARKGLDESEYTSRQLGRVSAAANRSFITATKNGIWGDPRRATAREGRRILDEIITNLAKESQTWLTVKRRKLHQ